MNENALDAENGRSQMSASMKKFALGRGSSGTHYLSMKQEVKDFIHAGVSLWWRILFPGFEKVWHGDCFTHWHGGRTQNPVSSLSRQTQESTRC
jgi:pantothenate kinase-related protein Tda10